MSVRQNLMTHSMASPESHRRATAEALRAMRALAGHIDDMKRKHESAVRVQEVQSLVRLWQVSPGVQRLVRL